MKFAATMIIEPRPTHRKVTGATPDTSLSIVAFAYYQAITSIVAHCLTTYDALADFRLVRLSEHALRSYAHQFHPSTSLQLDLTL